MGTATPGRKEERMRLDCVTLVVLGAACTGEIGPDEWVDVGDPEVLEGAPENEGVIFASDLAAGDTARVCTSSGLRQRSAPSTSSTVLRVMPDGSTVRVVERSGVWVKNDWSGLTGWSHSSYLCKVTSPPVEEPPPSGGESLGGGYTMPHTRAGIVALARAMQGFSYWWGGARFSSGGASGACYGSCPSCSHSGTNGADCSGFVNKAWMLDEVLPMDTNKHGPASSYWYSNGRSTTRAAIQPGDAMVRNGHMFLYTGGDAWGSMNVCESKGCAYKTQCHLRTASSSYRVIRAEGI
jgi:hypothetical protein